MTNTPETSPLPDERPSNEPQGSLPLAACSTVPFDKADIERRENVTLTNGLEIKLPGDRSVEVWRVKDEDSYAVRIFRPTRDGKRSKLIFGLSGDAATALATLLAEHLSNNPAQTPEGQRPGGCL